MFLKILLLAFIIELLTILARLLFGPIYTHPTWKNLPRRIYYGYIGLLILVVSAFFYPYEIWIVLGASLFIADAIHHFVVLPLWVGKTEYL